MSYRYKWNKRRNNFRRSMREVREMFGSDSRRFRKYARVWRQAKRYGWFTGKGDRGWSLRRT